jgi:DNA primase large subunit
MKKILASLLLTPVIFISCVTSKKMNTGKTKLTTIDSQLVSYSKSLEKLDNTRKEKEEKNQIDDTASGRIKKFINNTYRQIDTLIDQNKVIINGNEVSRDDWNKLNKAIVTTQEASQKINRKILFLDDLINRNMVVKLDQDVLFQPGSYTITSSVVAGIGKLFEPAALEIDKFSAKYPDIPMSLVITAKGYADATSISEGSGLYNKLKERLSLSNKEPDAKELNKELSRARAEGVKELFKQYAESRNDNGIYKRTILYVFEGKGDALPNPEIKDYTLDDARRRVVLLFWSVFPE